MIRGIHHTAISTADLARALAFYRDLLGFEEVLDFRWPEGTEKMNRTQQLPDSSGRVVMLKAGNAMIELFQYETPTAASRDPRRRLCDHGLAHFCLDVDDIDAKYARLLAGGMEFHCPPVDYGTVKTTYGRDPDGNYIELQQIKSADDTLALDVHRQQARRAQGPD
jgi:catechol 2,3-dioxygenase-like lactoylglutathione lyase family enzyme